ncbi:MAG: POTRA domain-containing protein, partial [Thermoanaerobaculia bacterium]
MTSPPLFRRLLVSTLAALLAVPAPVAVYAQGSLAGRPIEAIEFQGLRALSEETVLYYLGLERGQPLDLERLDRNIKALWDRNLIDDIEVNAQPTETGGARLVVRIVERPIIRSVDYQGMKRISRNDLLDDISSKGIRLREGDPLSLGELYRVKALIEEMYEEKGYRFAAASYTIED